MPKKKAFDTAKLIKMIDDETPQTEIMKKMGFKTSTQLKAAYMSALMPRGKFLPLRAAGAQEKPRRPKTSVSASVEALSSRKNW